MVKQVNKAKRVKKGKRAKKVEDIKDVEKNGKKRILIVDDDEGICRSLSLILGRKGYETETAGTGQEALEKARKEIFDLALIDIRLPDVEGVDLLEPLKEMHPDMPMVMITAYASAETAMRALNGQAVAYITKPLDIDEMLARIEEILEKERLIREKQQVEEALRESEATNRALLEAVPDAIFRLDKQGTYTGFIPAKGFQTIVSPGEFLGRNQEEVLPPELAEKSKHYLEQALQTGETQSYEYPLAFGGETRHYEARLIPTEGDGVLGIVRDITERKRAEEALRESEERYRVLAENVTDVIFTADVNMRTTYVSPSVTLQRGYTVEETMAHTFEEMMPPYSIQIVTKAFAEALAAEEAGERPSSYSLELELYCKDGSTMWTELRGSFVRDSEGQFVEVLGVVRDISERKQVEEALRESEEKLRIMFSSISDGITVTDLEGNITDVNEAQLRTFGYSSKEEVIGRNGIEFIAEKDHPAVMEGLVSAVRLGFGATRYYTMLTRDGREFEAEATADPLYDVSGNPVGLVSIVRDITERKRAEEALRESEEKLRIMFDSVADSITITDISGKIVDLNRAGANLLGKVGREEAIGQDAFKFIAESSRAKAMEDMSKALEGKSAGLAEYTFLTADGTEFEAESSNALLRDALGNPVGFVSINRDITERKRMQEELLIKDRAMEASINAIDMVDLQGVNWDVQYVNPAFLDMWGYDSDQEVLNRSARDFWVNADELAGIVQSLDEEGSWRGELEALRKDGLTFDVQVSASVVRDEEGTPICLMGSFVDITERKRAEKALRESEERYRTLFERAPASITVVDTSGCVVDCNESTEKLTGYSREEIIGKSFEALVTLDPKDLPKLRDDYERLSKGLELKPYELEVIRKDREQRWIVVRHSLLFDGDSITGFQIFATDITERKWAEEALLESEEKMRSLFENSPDIIMEIDCESKLLFINHTVPGFTKEEVIGTPAFDYIAPEERDRYKDAVARVFDTGEALSVETRGAGPERRVSWYETRFGPVMREDKVASAMLIASDVTERREAEEELNAYRDHLEDLVEERTTELQARTSELEQANTQLQEADRLKSIFLASMSHELRTPLNSIIGFTGIILQGMVGELNEEQRRQLTMVKSSASHLLELINDLLDVSRVEAGRVDLWLEEFSLDDVVREVAEICLPMVNEKGLDFGTEVPENVILFSDRRRVKQILMNFASNAIKFSERGGIRITARVLEGEKLEMRVADTGIGIEKDNMDRLFRPFQQIDMSLPKRYGGSGLGLYLSRKLADLLGGDVWAESEYGVGSEFSFALPLKYGEGRRDEEEDTSG